MTDKKKSSEVIQLVQNEFLILYKDLFIYETNTKTWYKWNTIYWEKKHNIEIEVLVNNVFQEVAYSEIRISLVREVLHFLRLNLMKDFQNLSWKRNSFINFLNGTLDTRTLKFYTNQDSRQFFLTSVVQTEYKEDALPSEELKKLLCMFVGNNLINLQLLRGAIRRVIEPSEKFQTGFWLYGEPGTGKSTFTNWIQNILLDRSCEINSFKVNSVNKSELNGKNVIVISDGSHFESSTITLLKQLTGRDSIFLNKRSSESTSFLSEAVVFVTSNSTIGEATKLIGDASFLDRFFPIHFPTRPNEPNTELKNYLLQETSAIINWALEVPGKYLLIQIRVGNLESYFNSTNDFRRDFASNFLIPEEGAFISNKELLSLLDIHYRQNGLHFSPGERKGAAKIILSFLQKTYSQYNITEARENNIRGLRNIRAKRDESEQHLCLNEPKTTQMLLDIMDVTEIFQKRDVVTYEKVFGELNNRNTQDRKDFEIKPKKRGRRPADRGFIVPLE